MYFCCFTLLLHPFSFSSSNMVPFDAPHCSSSHQAWESHRCPQGMAQWGQNIGKNTLQYAPLQSQNQHTWISLPTGETTHVPTRRPLGRLKLTNKSHKLEQIPRHRLSFDLQEAREKIKRTPKKCNTISSRTPFGRPFDEKSNYIWASKTSLLGNRFLKLSPFWGPESGAFYQPKGPKLLLV